MKKHWMLAVVFCVGLLGIHSLDRIYCEQENQRYAWTFDKFAERLQLTLQEQVNGSLDIVEDLRAFMLAGETIPDKKTFERFVDHSIKKFPEIINMAYTDETYAIRYLYPVGPGPALLGTSVADVSQYRYFLTATVKAERENRIALNPVPVQMSDGRAIFGPRASLFSGERFQGMVWGNFDSVSILREAVAKADPALARNEGNYYIEVLTADGRQLYKVNQPAPQSEVREFAISVADTAWLVKTGWSRLPQSSMYIRAIIWGLGGSVLVLMLLLLNGMIRRQTWLARAVAEKTQELLEKNNQLEKGILQHKQAEQALVTSEQRMTALLAAVPDKLFRISREGRILDIETKNPQDLYLPPSEFLYKNLTDVLPAETYSKFAGLLETPLPAGQLVTIEYQLTINNRKRDLEARIAASAHNEFLVIVRDITAKKQDEACEQILTQVAVQVLEETGIETILTYVCEQLTAIFEISLARVILKAEDDTIKISAAAGKLALQAENAALNCTETGRLSGRAIRTGVIQVIQYKDKLSAWQEKLITATSVARKEIQSEIALPLNLKGGAVGAFYLISNKTHYWNERIVARLQHFSHQLAIAIGAARDRQRLRLLITGLEAAANAIVITDKDGIIKWINSAFTRLTGYTAEDASGRNLMRLSVKQDKEFCRQFWLKLSTDREAWRGELANCRKDGSGYQEVMTITPVFNNQEEIVNFIAIKEDITEQKMAAMAMAKANEVRAQAEKLSSMGTMAAGLSHEINQPLNSIKMIASGMVYAYHNGKERPVGDMMRNVEEISNQADRINNIIMHMRSFIRRDNSRVIACDVNEAVEQALKIIGSQLTAHGIKIQKELAEEVLLVYATPTALEEIIVNMASNAMQAMNEVEGQDKKIVFHTWAEKTFVNIRISDTGPGIPADQSTRIFEPFFSTKPGADNLGLGLSIVQSIVTSCQGTIKIVSGENEGAAFLITFPGIGNERM